MSSPEIVFAFIAVFVALSWTAYKKRKSQIRKPYDPSNDGPGDDEDDEHTED